MNRRLVPVIALVATLVLCAWLSRETDSAPAASAQGDRFHAVLPLALQGAALADLPRASTAVPNQTAVPPTATATPTLLAPTETSLPPSATPTSEPTATEAPHTGRIHGRLTVTGEPISAGFGAEALPQIELRRCLGGDCQKVANAITEDGGTFAFDNPPALEAGYSYQVWWVNDVDLGYDGYLHRWWSRFIPSFGNGEDVDLGTFEVADLNLTNPCHDCLQTLPITFKWDVRSNKGEIYRWSLFKDCGNVDHRFDAYRSQPLGHAGELTVNSPPPGYRYDEKYCWYIFIEDGQNGTGWTFHDRRVTFCSSPATCH